MTSVDRRLEQAAREFEAVPIRATPLPNIWRRAAQRRRRRHLAAIVVAAGGLVFGVAQRPGPPPLTRAPAAAIDLESIPTTVLAPSTTPAPTTTAAPTTTVAPNRAPVANDDAMSVRSGSVIVIDPAVNDSDPDGDTLRLSGVGAPRHGEAQAAEGSTSVTYRAPAGFVGNDTFTYVVRDDSGRTATATVHVHVTDPLDGQPPAT